ncbi:hypothetical protein AZ928_09735 [Salmonella enterica]|uniref:Uncharacterized protein n=2 Tax=Salmonella enterica TaxID=28901 RepID=A0A760BWF7_SALER|nr:hypothetical protein [Salmonella enterica]ECD2965793.1 hypothetical protein [Salmonella enterica subsp. enterica serovar Typhimurium]ECG1713827.1 hypothetical protein [Salmonella enterica subsp. enterica]ECX7031076.1 hypothetical protein [Salmonella enterica subsp. enterica serovar Mbandaka]EDU1088695.1 hypothetical protein [Salmonella enterica subsp. enterica serovar Coleypark]EEJ5538284.1 hypothetical protein [Salmonella enterica subsp. enterica serovar Thompson]EHP8331098.1 hypothetical
MDIVDVRKLAWNRRNVVAFMATVDVGTVKSTYDFADDFIAHHGIDPNSGIGGIFYDIVNNMCAGFDYLIRVGDVSVHRDNEGLPHLTILKHSGLSPVN